MAWMKRWLCEFRAALAGRWPPAPVDRDRIERIARFQHLNYPTGCCRGRWEEIDQDCRDGWIAEAEVIYGIATGERG